MPTHDEFDEPLIAPYFTALRASSSGLNTPPRVEKELLAAFAKQFPKQRWYQRLSVRQWGMAGGLISGAGAMALLVFTLILPAPQHPGHPAMRFDEGGDFIALESRERIELEASPQLVETTVPRTSLASLDGALTPQTAGDTVRVELLVGADGEPLALRLLPQ
ncbi:hypothetical protein [Pseudoduganella rhizocola]|uniref:hypothetical protein n=1 Tax=Pseudoduganella rhizocola TaxID=3382643 RepID=UPI0038B4D463